MPILESSTPTTSRTILTLAQEACLRAGNRSDYVDRACVYIADAIIELTSDPELRDDFDELEVWGLPFSLEAGTQEYPFSNFLQAPAADVAGENPPFPQYNQATLSVMIWSDYPTNTRRVKLNPTHYQDTDRVVVPNGSIPSQWYRFGDSIGFNPIPNQPYQVIARILMMHPIQADPGATPLLLSREWDEILEWRAVESIYMDMQQFEKATEVHKLLHGDPRYPAKPGIWGAKHTRRKKEAHRVSGGLRPIIRGYGFGRR